MIVSIGSDICDKSRIEKAVAKLGDKFAQRILCPSEFAVYQGRADRVDYLARRFAAKEACVKALGLGIGRGIGWQQMEINNNEFGAPCLRLSGAAKERFDVMGAQTAHISLSDEKGLALAFVVFERSA